MYCNHTVGVVIPAYNEEAFVGDVVTGLPEFVDAVYLVDDASTDGTWRVMGEVMDGVRANRATVHASGQVTETISRARAPLVQDRISDSETVGRVTRLRHDENRGAGGAVKTGYLAALADDVDVIATIDGDGQMDPARLPAVLDPVVDGRAGYAKGNRFAGTDVFREMPPFRLVGNLLLTGLTRIASGYWSLSDPQNGFTAISRHALEQVDVESSWEYYGYMNQLVARLNAADVRVEDVAMPATYGDEDSGIVTHQYVRRVSVLLFVSFVQRLWSKYAARESYSVVAGYAVGGLSGISALRKGIQSVRFGGQTPDWSAVVERLGMSLTAFAVAAVLDSETEPVVVDRPETDRGEATGQRETDWKGTAAQEAQNQEKGLDSAKSREDREVRDARQ